MTFTGDAAKARAILWSGYKKGIIKSVTFTKITKDRLAWAEFFDKLPQVVSDPSLMPMMEKAAESLRRPL